MIHILGIETSCDETALAIVNEQRQICAHQVYSQIKEHSAFGGVVPELAARNHLARITPLWQETLTQANITLDDIDAFAVTSGPGLIGGLLVGVMFTKAMHLVTKKPIINVNHLEAHALTIRLTHNIPFPYLLFLTSGGHCQILVVKGIGQYELYGQTIDDAMGEAFDKVGKMLGIPYPFGPNVELYAQKGDETRFSFPIPLYRQPHCNFSFSGLKTAVLQLIQKIKPLSAQDSYDICASFQKTVAASLCDRAQNALLRFKQTQPQATYVVMSGGVAANEYLRNRLGDIIMSHGCELMTPPKNLCTDNAAMVAWVGVEKYHLQQFSSIDFLAKPRWPLTEFTKL